MIKIVTDSTVQLSNEEQRRYNVHIIPINIIIDGKSYLDSIDLTREKFMEIIKNNKKLPTTSQPSIGQFVDLYDRLGEDGSEIFSIHIARSLSGTYNAAVQAAKLSKSNVSVFDSHFVDRPMAHQVMLASKLAENGKTIQEIESHLTRLIPNQHFYIGVTHLDNLIKSGRINHTIGRISTFLNLKVVLKWSELGLKAVKKGRGFKAISSYFESVLDEMKMHSPLLEIGISHTGWDSFSDEWLTRIKNEFPNVPIHIGHACSSLSVHAGENAFAISFLPSSIKKD